MMVPVVLVKCAFPRGVTVVMKRRTYCAVSESKSGTAVCCMSPMMAHRQSSDGWVYSNVRTLVSDRLTAGSTFAESHAIDKTPIPLTAFVPQMWSRIVLAARRPCATFRMFRVPHAKIQYQIAQNLAELNSLVAIRVKSGATKASVLRVCKTYRSAAVVEELHRPRSVTRVSKNRHIA